MFNKAVELLMCSKLNKSFNNKKILGKLKVLTFNNLACLYKKKRKFGISLRAVKYALKVEEYMLKDQSSE